MRTNPATMPRRVPRSTYRPPKIVQQRVERVPDEIHVDELRHLGIRGHALEHVPHVGEELALRPRQPASLKRRAGEHPFSRERDLRDVPRPHRHGLAPKRGEVPREHGIAIPVVGVGESCQLPVDERDRVADPAQTGPDDRDRSSVASVDRASRPASPSCLTWFPPGLPYRAREARS